MKKLIVLFMCLFVMSFGALKADDREWPQFNAVQMEKLLKQALYPKEGEDLLFNDCLYRAVFSNDPNSIFRHTQAGHFYESGVGVSRVDFYTVNDFHADPREVDVIHGRNYRDLHVPELFVNGEMRVYTIQDESLEHSLDIAIVRKVFEPWPDFANSEDFHTGINGYRYRRVHSNEEGSLFEYLNFPRDVEIKRVFDGHVQHVILRDENFVAIHEGDEVRLYEVMVDGRPLRIAVVRQKVEG